MGSGALYVKIPGTQETQMWLADNLDFLMLHFQPAIVQAIMQGKSVKYLTYLQHSTRDSLY